MRDKNLYEPSQVVWEITLKCNLKCSHCGSRAGKCRPDELSTKEALKLCDDLAELGFRGIGLMGGELFLRKDWELISERIKDLGIALSIISNGFFNPKIIIPKMTKLKVDCFMIGFDGATAKTHDSIRGVSGSFDKAVQNLIAVKKAGLMTGVITTVHRININELPKIRDFIVKEKLDWQIQMATPIGRFKKKLSLTEEEYYALALFILQTKQNYSSEAFTIAGTHNFGFHSDNINNLSFYPDWAGCVAGKRVLGIQSNGSIKGCLALSDDFIEDNIRNRSIIDIWNDPNSFAFSRRFNEKNLGENCKGCKYSISCKGGCTTRSCTMTNKPHNDPYCFYRIEQKVFNQK
jgi:radical SAM protein with 4Fe4S-binding SPASM domain